MEAGVQGNPQLHREVKASVRYMKPCLKIKILKILIPLLRRLRQKNHQILNNPGLHCKLQISLHYKHSGKTLLKNPSQLSLGFLRDS